MLTELCQYLRNWFVREGYPGRFKVEGGALTYEDGTTLPLLTGQYFRIIGSVFNDGVHKLGDSMDTLADEPVFIGAVWSMAVPPAVTALSADIDKWCTDNAGAINSPYSSESFGGYSYTTRGGGRSADGGEIAVTWQSQFASRLAPWRKI